MTTETDWLRSRVRSLEFAILHARKVILGAMRNIPERYEGVKESLSVLRDELLDVLRRKR